MPAKRVLRDATVTGATSMTGPLTLPGLPTQNNHAATKQYVDQNIPAGGNYVQSTTVTSMVKLTRAAYDALGTKDAATLYVIVG